MPYRSAEARREAYRNESPEQRGKRQTRMRVYRETHVEEVRQANASWVADHPRTEYLSGWREKNSEHTREYMRRRRAGLVGPFTEADGPDWQARNREDYLTTKRESTNRRRKEIFIEAITHYSNGPPRCYCCGEDIPILLGLDHIDGGGNQHRKAEKMTRTYMWAKKNGWPPIFRVACHSCNMGSYLNGGICPHRSHGVDTSIC